MAGTSRRSRSIDAVIEALRSGGPASQAALSRRTELAPATVNNIVQSLRSDGIVELRPVNGREALVELTIQRGSIVSLRVSTSSIEGALFDFAAGERFEAVAPETSTPAAAIELIRKLCPHGGESPAAAIAVGIEAPIDSATGAVAAWASSRMPGWKGLNIGSLLEAEFGVPVIADNDANFDALAEWTWGAGRGADCFLHVTSSEGIGSGLIIDGNIHRGSDGMAGLLGHMVVEEHGAICFCGNRGCLSTLVSERAIVNSLHGSEAPKASLREIVDAAEAGDAACQRVLFEAGRYLGRALANAAKVISPEVVCVGGVLGEAEPFVLDGLTSSIEVTTHHTISPRMHFATSRLGDSARLLGGLAAALVSTGQGINELSPWMSKPSGTNDLLASHQTTADQ